MLGVETPDEEEPAAQQRAHQGQGQQDTAAEQEEEEEQQGEGSGEASEGGADADAMDVDGGEGARAGPSRAPGARRQQQQQQAGGMVEVTTHLREYLLDGTVTAREEMGQRLGEGGAAGGGVQRITFKHIDGEGGLLDTAFEVGLAGHGAGAEAGAPLRCSLCTCLVQWWRSSSHGAM